MIKAKEEDLLQMQEITNKLLIPQLRVTVQSKVNICMSVMIFEPEEGLTNKEEKETKEGECLRKLTDGLAKC